MTLYLNDGEELEPGILKVYFKCECTGEYEKTGLEKPTFEHFE